MSSKLLSLSMLVALFSLSANAQEFNGYIVKVKKGSSALSSKSISNIGRVTNVAETQFGTFGKLETTKSLSDKSMQALMRDSEIEYIEPNYIITLSTPAAEEMLMPTDASFKKQWGLSNTGKNGGLFSFGVAGEDVNALKAWEITKGNKEIKIAVIDTGVNYNHPDLKAQMDVNDAEFFGLPGVDDDGNGYVDDIYGYNFSGKNGDPADGHGHGTHCAGVIGASHNEVGIAGVMANVKIVGIKFLSDRGSGESIDAIASIDYAIKRGVHIMSNSWGGGEYSEALKEAISAANDAGITFIAASGNDGRSNDSRPTYPANYDVPNVISVGSYTNSGSKSSFSNFGVETVHVMAPGSSILSTYKNGYSNLSGTSMAAPHVSGVVGLLLSEEPNLSPIEIRERLINTSVKTEKLKTSSKSAGRVDAHRALINK